MSGSLADANMLTTQEAAKLLGCSCAHVAMLIDGGKLACATRAGGDRRVPESSVRALKKKRDEARKPNADYRAAGVAAGIYDIPEEQWKAPVRAR